MTDISTNIMFFAILLLLSAIFSSSETAFTAINKIRLRTLLDKKHKGAKNLEKLLDNPRRLITGILIGNTLVNIAIPITLTPPLLNLLAKFGLNNHAAEILTATLIITFIVLLFGEITPKVFAILFAENFALFFAKPIGWFLLIFKPIIICFELITNIIYKLFKVTDQAKNHPLTEDELKIIVNMGEEAGILEKKEMKMINSIFEFSKTIVREIMTPRTDAICIEIETDMNEVISRFIEMGHSRIPVYEGRLDNIVGIVYAKDLLSVSINSEKISLKSFLREAVFIPETQSIEELLQQMKKNKFHMAIVVDEHGGVAGLVTLEDIIEEIVGEIQDEHEKNAKPTIQAIKPNHYLINAKINISDLPEELLNEFPENEDYDTIGGFVLYILGRVPQKEEKISYKNMRITVKELNKRRILKLEIEKVLNLDEKVNF